MATTNFPNGITNNTSVNILGSLIEMDPTTIHTYFNDFDTYLAGEWVVTETQAGATEALADEDGGVLLLTNSAADNDVITLQKVGESFKFETGKPTFFKARFKLSDATQSDMVMGLMLTNSDPFALEDEAVIFAKDDGDANLDFYVINSSSSAATAITTLTDNTYITVGFFYNGKDRVEYAASTNSLNPTKLGSLSVDNLPTSTEITVTFGVKNGAAAAKNMSVDYIFAAKTR